MNQISGMNPDECRCRERNLLNNSARAGGEELVDMLSRCGRQRAVNNMFVSIHVAHARALAFVTTVVETE